MAADAAILILRVVLGLTMAAHGYNKFFGGGRIAGTARWFESIGMKPGTFYARAAAITELAAGLGLALGVLTPAPAAGFAGTGAGRYSLDYALFHTAGFYPLLHGWCGLAIAVVLGLAGGIGQFATFFSPPAKVGSA